MFDEKTGSITLVKRAFAPFIGRICLENKESKKRLRRLVMLWCSSFLKLSVCTVSESNTGHVA